MSKSNIICGAKNILLTPMSLMLNNYFFLTVKDQSDPGTIFRSYWASAEIGPPARRSEPTPRRAKGGVFQRSRSLLQ